MGELTEAERRALRKVMKRLGWRPLGDTALDRELEPRFYELIMPSYSEGLQEGWNESFREGLKQAYRQNLADLYQARFGDIPEALRVVIEGTEDEDMLRRWVVLAGTGTAEGITAAVLAPGIGG
jgi:hypothetical protein